MNRFHFHVPYLLKKDINELYIANAIRSFSLGTIGIFIPIFLLEKGFGFIGIGIYLMIQTLIMAQAVYPLLKLAARFGIKHNMLISSPLMIIFFLLLNNIEFFRTMFPDLFIVIVLGFIVGLADSMYWSAFHVDFAKSTQLKKSAKQYGFFRVTSTIASSIAPLVGGVLISLFGFTIMFSLVIILLFVAVLPLFFSSEQHVPFKVSFKEITSNKHSRYILPFFGEGMHYTALAVVWPLFLYLLFTAYNQIGSIYTIANGVSILTTLFVTNRFTEINKYIYLKMGTWLHSISMIVRLFAKSYLSMVFAMSFAGFTNSLMSNPYYNTFYNSAKKHGLTTIVFMREFYLNLGRFAMSLIFLILLFYLEPEPLLIVMMLIGAVMVFFRANIREDIKAKN